MAMKPRSIYFVVGKTLSSSWFQCLYSLNIIYRWSFDVVKEWWKKMWSPSRWQFSQTCGSDVDLFCEVYDDICLLLRRHLRLCKWAASLHLCPAEHCVFGCWCTEQCSIFKLLANQPSRQSFSESVPLCGSHKITF